MADFNQQIYTELRAMNETLKRQSNSFAGTEQKAGDGIAADRANSRTAAEKREGSALIRSTLNTLSDETKSFVGHLRNTYGDLQKLEQTVSHANIEEMKKVREARQLGLIEKDYAAEAMRDLGGTIKMVNMSNDEFDSTIVEATRSVGSFQTAVMGNTRVQLEAMEDISENLGDNGAGGSVRSGLRSFADSVMGNVPALGRLRNGADVAYAAMVQLYDGAQKSRQTGIKISKEQYADALMMGMSRDELLDTMATYRQQMESGGQSTQQFQDMMKASSFEMYDYGLSLKDGGIMAAEAAKSYRLVAGEAASLEGQASFLDKQQDVYKSLYDSIGMTAEKFSEMTKAIDDSQEIQKQLFKLDKSKRAGYKNDLLVSQKKFILDGLTLQQAGALVTKLNELSGQDGKSRLKQAAKAQAAFGAVGMGADGERVAQLIRTGAKGEGEQAELKGLMERFREATGEMQSSGDIGQEMYADALMKVAGMEGIMQSVEQAIMQRGMEVQDKISENTTRMKEEFAILGEKLGFTGNDLIMFGEYLKNAAANPMDAATALALFTKDGWAGLMSGGASLFKDPVAKLDEMKAVFWLIAEDMSNLAGNIKDALGRMWDKVQGKLMYIGWSIQDAVFKLVSAVKPWGDEYVSPNFTIDDFVSSASLTNEKLTAQLEAAAAKADKKKQEFDNRIAEQLAANNQTVMQGNVEMTGKMKEINDAITKQTEEAKQQAVVAAKLATENNEAVIKTADATESLSAKDRRNMVGSRAAGTR
jgi:hypothetical protein